MPEDPGIPSDESATVLTSCLFCPAMIETRTGIEGEIDMAKAGWERIVYSDYACPECAEARADLIGEER